jgi:uncharacterized integral membrane protein
VWVIKGLFFLLLLIVLVVFFAANSSQSVDIDLFGREYLDVPIFWVLLLAYLLGFATCFVMAAVRQLRVHGEIRQLRRTVQARDKEISELRTLPLQDYRGPALTEGRDG